MHGSGFVNTNCRAQPEASSMKKQTLGVSLALLACLSASGWATTTDPGWQSFVIRLGSVSGQPPIIQNNNAHVPGAVEFTPFEAGQMAGLGTDLISGQPVSRISSLHIDRLDNIAGSGSLYGPYFNVWVTDGAGHYAVIANEPSNPEWGGNPWDISSWDLLKTKTCKVYETPGWNSNSSWIHALVGSDPLTFEDVGGLTIEAPPASYITNPANGVGGGAPDVLGTNEAWGFNWIFGDTASNYVIYGGEGFVVANYTAEMMPVANHTQGLYYSTIQAAIDGANAGDEIRVGPGSYYETASDRWVFGTNGPHRFGLFIDKALTIKGVKADGSPVTSIAEIGAVITTNSNANFGPSGIFVQADGVTLEGLEIGDNIVGGVVSSNKTIEVVGDAFAMHLCKVNTSLDEGAFYMGEWDITHPVSAFSLTDCAFHNTLVSINNGVGQSGAVTSRVITGNTFSGVATPYVIGFRGWNGPNPVQGWIVSPVGGAVVTGNTFANTGVVSYVIARGNAGGYDNSQLDWNAIWTLNTYGNAAVPFSSISPADVRSYADAAGYSECRRIAPAIQTALNVAQAGDVVSVKAGHYEEQLRITADNLSLLGAGVGQSFIDSPPTLPLFFTTSADNHPVVFIDQVEGVTMSGFTVNGLGRAAGNYRFTGIGALNSGGTFSNLRVTGLRETPLNGSQHGVGILVSNSDAATRTLTVSNVDIDDFQKNGTVFTGVGLTVNATQLDVVGSGPLGLGLPAQNGIQVSGGTQFNGTACTVSGVNYTPMTWAACGFLVMYDGSATLTNCSTDEVLNPAYFYQANVTANNFSIANPISDGIYAFGMEGARTDGGARQASPFDDGLQSPAQRSTYNTTLLNSTLVGNGAANSWGVGAMGTDQSLTLSNCSISNFDYGLMIYGADAVVSGSATSCTIAGNLSYGAYNGSPLAYDARGCYWGAVDGPSGVAPGSGDAVSAGILYEPFLTSAYHVNHTLSNSLISVSDSGTPASSLWSFTYDNTAPGAAGWRTMVVELAWDGSLVTPSAPAFQFGHADGVVNAYDLLDANTMEVSMSITGLTLGQLTDTNLFTLTLDGIAQGLSSLQITNVRLYGVQNPPVILSASWDEALSITVDGTGPVTTATYPTATCINDDFDVALSVVDNYALQTVQYRTNSGAWAPVASGLSGTTYTATFTVPISGLDEGDNTIEFRAIDDVANEGGLSASWTFHIDRLTPVAASGLDARPAHNACNLYWTAGSELDGYTLYYKLRTGYPYPTRSSAWGGNLAEADGSLAVGAGATTYTFITDNSTAARGIYDFILVSEDCINADAVSTMASATNYFLGDVASVYNGIVFSEDLDVMAAVYGSTPTTDPGREMNVGPTTDGSSYGLPYGTTARVNFEDLIIFAINYGPAGPELPVTVSSAGETPVVRLEQTSDGFALVLSGQLKGFSARLESEAALLDASSDAPVFFYREGNAWMVDVASLQGNLLDGTTVALRFAGEGAPTLASVDGRDARNQNQAVTALGLNTNLPTSYALEQNFPNPFNPTTTIRFALPEAASVRLALYNAVGQEVLTLVQGVREAGLHEIVLDGSSLASGVYVYRLEAGRFADQKKLVLVK